MTKHFVAGKNAVYEMLRSGKRRVHRLYLSRRSEDPTLQEIKRLALKNSVPLQEDLPSFVIQQSGVEVHQGVVAEADPFSYTPLDAVVAKACADPKGGFLIFCDEIQDPQNLGSLIRTAHLLGAHGLVIPKHRSAEVTATVAKASAGAVEYLPIVKETNLVNVINLLKEKDFSVYGAAGDGAQSLYETTFSGSVVLVLGAEGRGLKNIIIKHCDATLFIPMKGEVGSFNVSVAGAILMAEVTRQRGG